MIKTFEVTLGSVQRVQIGWNRRETQLEIQNTDKGIGDISSTYALDLTRSSFLVDGTSTSVDRLGLEQAEGTVVRSEDFGKVWYVNGNLVAPFSRKMVNGMEKIVEKVEGSYSSTITYKVFPFVSVTGEVEITSVEFKI